MLSRLLLLLLLGATTISIADDFSDFRRPTQSGTRLHLLTGVDTYWYYRDDTVRLDRYERSSNAIALRLEKFQESDEARFETELIADFGFNREYNEYVAYNSIYHRDSQERSVQESIYLVLNGDKYIHGSNFGGLFNLTSNVKREQSWRQGTDGNGFSYSTRRETVFDGETSGYKYLLRGDVAFGYGKVRRATSVFTLHIFEKRLRELGIIENSLQHETRQKLIDLYARSAEYSYRNERSSKYFWDDLESILLSDTSLAGKRLSAYDWSRLRESDKVSGIERKTGWFIGPVATWDYGHEFDRSKSNVWERHYDSNDSLTSDTTMHSSQRSVEEPGIGYSFAGIGCSYHKPLGIRTQFDLSAYLELPVNPAGDGYISKVDLDFAYLLTEKLLFDNSIGYFRFIEDPKRRASQHFDEWAVTLNSGFYYWVEDRIYVSMSLSHEQGNTDYYYPEAGDYGAFSYDRDTSLRVGLSYTLLGSGYTSSYRHSSHSASRRRYLYSNPLP